MEREREREREVCGIYLLFLAIACSFDVHDFESQSIESYYELVCD